MRPRDVGLVALGVLCVVAIMVIGSALGVRTFAWAVSLLLLFVGSACWVYMRSVHEIRRQAEEIAAAVDKTEQRVADVQHTVGALGTRLQSISTRQQAIYAVLRKAFPAEAGPDKRGAYNAYARAMMRTMQPRPTDELTAFERREGEDDDIPPELWARKMIAEEEPPEDE